MSTLTYTKNPLLAQDMVSHAFKRFADTGDVIPPRQRTIYEGISHMAGGRSILEAGCGIGIGTAILRGKPFIYKAQEAVHRIVIGTDYDPKHVDFARQIHPHCTFDLWDITKGPYPAKLYDWIVAVEVLEHLEDPEAALRNLVLSAKEAVWISTPNRMRIGATMPPNNPHHVQEFTQDEIVEIASPLVSYVYVRCWWDLTKGPTAFTREAEVSPLVYELIL